MGKAALLIEFRDLPKIFTAFIDLEHFS